MENKDNETSSVKTKANINILELTLGVLALVLGIIVRVNFMSGADLPLNDGGFFYQMTEDLVGNGFLIPEYTLYNLSEIPFAYPPLAFYILGSIHYLTGISLLALFTYFPLVISCITIPVFYILTERFFEEKIYRLLAVFIFATLPRSFEWFVMGGGATRSLGFLFAMLSIYFLWGAFQDNELNSKAVYGATFAALTILSHPVTSLFLIFSATVIFIYHFPVNIKILLVVPGMILLATLPWWGTVLNYHGISPFIGASNTGHINWFEIKNLVTLNFGYENPYFLAIVSVFAVLGLFSKRKKMSWTLGTICVLGYFFIPRGGVDLLTLYLSLLAVIGFQVVTGPWNEKADLGDKNDFPFELKAKRTRYLLGLLAIYLFLGSYTYKYVYGKSNLRLNDNNIQAMEWLKKNSKETDSVLLIPPSEENRYWWNDFISEWFPAITKRESITTVQGYEWKPDVFAKRITLYTSLRSCSQDYDCIISWQTNYSMKSEYIYFDDLEKQWRVSADFLESGMYDIVFENDTVMIIGEIY